MSGAIARSGVLAGAAACILAVGFLLLGWNSPAQASFVSMPAPSFSGTTIDGQAVSLESYRGKPLVLVLWQAGG